MQIHDELSSIVLTVFLGNHGYLSIFFENLMRFDSYNDHLLRLENPSSIYASDKAATPGRVLPK